MICTFSNLGVQCVKKKGIEEALKLREEIRVDPYHSWVISLSTKIVLLLTFYFILFYFRPLAGFAHKNQPQTIDLNAVRLCFQVFLEGTQKGKFTLALKPVVSETIYDKSKFRQIRQVSSNV